MYNDPTGHNACGPDDNCDHETLPIIINPWRQPASKSMIGLNRLNSDSPDQVFLNTMQAPLRGTASYTKFAKCNTYSQSCKDGWHPAIDSQTIWKYKEHAVVVNKIGRPIYSMAYGEVVFVGESDFGKTILIEHNVNGVKFYSLYAHLNDYSVKEGDIVGSQTIIGGMGNTLDEGDTTEVHLHFEVRKATNVKLTQSNPVSGNSNSFWPKSRVALEENFVDLGQVYGYDGNAVSMPIK